MTKINDINELYVLTDEQGEISYIGDVPVPGSTLFIKSEKETKRFETIVYVLLGMMYLAGFLAAYVIF